MVIGDHNLVATLNSTVVNRFEGPKPKIIRLPTRPLELGPEPEPIGRDRLIAEVRELLDQRIPVQVYGTTGIGKSSLLRAVARRSAAERQVIYINAWHDSLDDLCQDLFDSVHDAGGYRPADAERRRLLADLDAVIVVDHAGLPEEDLDRLFDYMPRCVFLIGSRERSLWRRGRALELTPLDEADARRLIVSELDRDLRPAEAPVVATALRESAGIPARLLRCGAYLHEVDIKGPGLAAARGLSAGAQTALLLSRSSEPARRVFAALAGLPDIPVAADVLPALAGIDVGAAVLEELRRSTLTVIDQGHFRVLSEVAAVMRLDVGGRFVPQELAAMMRRLTAWTVQRDPADVAGQADLLRRVLELAIEHRTYADARVLARAASTRLAASKRLDAWRHVLILGLRAAQSAKSSADTTYFRSGIEANQTCRRATAVAVGAVLLSARLAQEVGKGSTGKGRLLALKGGGGIAAGAGALAVGVAGVVVIHSALAKPHHHASTATPPLTVRAVSFTESRTSPPLRVTGTYEQVGGLKDPAVQGRVNASLRTAVDRRIDKFHKDAAALAPGTPITFADSARVLLKGPRVLSVLYAVQLDGDQSAHQWVDPIALDIDLGTGRTLTAREIFRPSVFAAEGRARLARQVDQAYDDPCVDHLDNVAAELSSHADFAVPSGSALGAAAVALTPTGLELVFEPYSVAIYGCGTPTIRLPYAQVTGLLQPSVLAAVSADETPSPHRS